jgi:hypothetical protein
MVSFGIDLDREHEDDIRFEVTGPKDDKLDDDYHTTSIHIRSGRHNIKRDSINLTGLTNAKFFRLADAIEQERQRRMQILADDTTLAPQDLEDMAEAFPDPEFADVSGS